MEEKRSHATVAKRMLTQKFVVKYVNLDVQCLKKYARLIEKEKKKVTLTLSKNNRCKRTEKNNCIQNIECKNKENYDCTGARSGDCIERNKEKYIYAKGAKFSKIEVKFANGELAGSYAISNLKTEEWLLSSNLFC